MLENLGTFALNALVAVGGNSRAARSARAKLQWRDRYGRFIEMGRGIKFKIRLGDGTVRSVNGKFVGAIDGETGQVYVQGDPSGLKDGFYQVKSANAQEILGSLSEADLAKRGIKLGYDANNNPVADRSNEQIPNASEIPWADAPVGWKRMPDVAGAQVWQTEDGDYRFYHDYKYVKGKKTEVWSIEDVNRAPGRVQGYRDLGYALGRIDAMDSLPEATPNVSPGQAKDDRNAALAALNDTSVPLKERLKEFDPNGTVAGLLDSGADGPAILDELRKNDAWKNVENDLFNPADKRQQWQKDRDAAYGKLQKEVANYKPIANIAADAIVDPNNKDAQAPGTNVTQTPDTPTTPGVDGAPVDINTDAFGVSKDGFLVPVGKSTDNLTPEGLAQFITENQDFLAEGGKRLLIDAENGQISKIEIANSAATLDDAKAQAGGAGAPEFYDVAAGQTVSNDKNLNNPASKENPNDQVRSSNSGESQPANASPDSGVQPADQPADNAGGNGSSGSGPDAPADGPDSTDALGQPIPADRAGLIQRLAFLERATNRVKPDSPAFDNTFKARDEVQARLDSIGQDAPADTAPDLSYQGGHRAPTNDGETPSLATAATGDTAYPKDLLGPDGVRLYGTGQASPYKGDEKAAIEHIREAMATGGTNKIKVYRAVPDDVADPKINPGDWVTPSRKYAEDHGKGNLGADKGYKVLELEVPASQLFTDGNSLLEWGYDPTGKPVDVPGAATSAPEKPQESQKTPDATPDTPKPEKAAQDSNAPAADTTSAPEGNDARLKALEKELAQVKGEQDAAKAALDNAGSGADAGQMSRADIANQLADEMQNIVDVLREQVNTPATPEVLDALRKQLAGDQTQAKPNPNPAGMTWKELQAELAVPVDAKSATLTEDLARYTDVQAEFTKRGAFRVPAEDRNSVPGLVPATEVRAPEPARVDNIGQSDPGIPSALQTPAVDTPAPDVVDTPGDGLPDNVADLEKLAGALELQIADARPARAKVLQDQVNAIYDKIDSLNPPAASDNPSGTDANNPDANALTPEQQALLDAPGLTDALANFGVDDPALPVGYDDAVSGAQIDNLVAGKDLSPELQNKVSRLDIVDPAEHRTIAAEVKNAPNKPNTTTKPRAAESVPSNLVHYDADLVAAELDNPSQIVDPNLIMADVRRNHPGAIEMPNGDLILEGTTQNGKRYDLVVRRMANERFFAYIMETDGDGNRRASRLQVDTHSYDALLTKIGIGKMQLRTNENLTKWMNRRKNRESLGKEDLADYQIHDYIDGVDIPRSQDAAYNKLVAGLAELANKSNTPRHFLDAMAQAAGQDPAFVDTIIEAINRRKVIDAQAELAEKKESHVSVDGEKLAPGDWIDWTDDKKTRPQKDEFGNTIYQTDENGNYVLRPNGKKIALNEPNPHYGHVFRGQVKQLRYKTNDGKYVYSDSTYVTFPELNKLFGRKPSHQLPRIGSQLKIVDSQNAPLSEKFFARKIEKRNQGQVANLPTPGSGDAGMLSRPRPVKPVVVEPAIDHNGGQKLPGFDVSVPEDHIQAAMWAGEAKPKALEAKDVVPGDMIVGLNENMSPVFETVLTVEDHNGDTRLRVHRVDNAGEHKVFERDMGTQILVVLRRDPQVVDARNVPNKPFDQIAVGDEINVSNIPGGRGKVEAFYGAEIAALEDKGLKVRGLQDGEVYWVQGDEVAPPAPEDVAVDANAPTWHNEPATAAQTYSIKRIIATRKLSDQERAELQGALNGGGLNKLQANDLINKYHTRALATNAEHFGGVKRAVDGLAKQGAISPVDAARINGRIEQDIADGAVPDKYQGQPVKHIKFEDVKIAGARAPFTNYVRLENGDMFVGDIFAKGAGLNRVLLQVVDRLEGNKLKVRVITQTPNGRVWIGGVPYRDGEVYTKSISYATNVKRANANAPKDYFADPGYIPPKPGIRGNNYVPVPDAADDPKLLARIDERGQKLLDNFDNGYTVVAHARKGVDAERADILQFKDGSKAFVKEGKLDRAGNLNGVEQAKLELMGNRVAQALGIEDVQMGVGPDGNTVVMSLVDGTPAVGNRQAAQKILTNIWDYPNAWRIGILDYVVNNVDRHAWNWMINSEGQPVPIDHGRIFKSRINSPFADIVLRDLSGGRAPVTSAELGRLRNNLGALEPLFARLGKNTEFELMMNRMQTLISKANK